MPLTVGPIQSYVPGSTWFDLTRYANLGTQERVSINLANSNLWLIDSSELYLPYDYAPRIAFINEGAGYQSPININTSGATNESATVFTNLSGTNSILPSSKAPLKVGDWVQLSTIAGGTQLNFSVTPNGVVNPGAQPLSTDYTLNPTGTNPNAPVFWVAYADPQATKPILLLGFEDIVGKGSDNDFNDGILAVDVGMDNFQAIFQSSNLGQNPSVNLYKAQAAPFEAHAFLGLIVLGLGWLGKRWWAMQAAKSSPWESQPASDGESVHSST